MTDKKKIKEEFDNFKSAYNNLASLTEGMSPEELELIHKIQVVLEKHEDILEDAAVEIITHEEEAAEEVLTEEEVSEDESCEEAAPADEVSSEDAASAEEASSEDAVPEEPAPLPEPPHDNEHKDIFDRISSRYRRWQPKSRLGRWTAASRHNVVMLSVIIIALLTGAWQGIAYAIPENVTIIYETIGEIDSIPISTRAYTVGDVLDSTGLEIGEKDLITPIREHQTKDGMEIRIRHATNAVMEYGGKKVDVLLIPGTVEENLKLNDLAYDDNDIIKPSLNTKITPDTDIVVKLVEVDVVEKTEKVKARSVVRLDPSLKSGVQEKVQGHDGKAVYQYTTTYINGRKKGTEKKVIEWKKKVQDSELRLGTSLTGHKGEFIVKDEFTGNTTAYWMGNNARGASGGRCVYGTCAVDPKRIPYGTDMWVEGYGYARANDCGSAIKNDHVDLWMHSYKESCQWGRRFVTVYVLDKK